MWFGDLVTMRWWNGIWLNEAFATFMAMLAVDAYAARLGGVEPVRALTDARRSRWTRSQSTRSIEYPVHSPDDANGMFDMLTYLKGGAILRMLEQYLGARPVPRRHPPVPAQARVRQHRDPRPVGRARGGNRRAGPPDHGHVDLAGRLPADLGDRRR